MARKLRHFYAKKKAGLKIFVFDKWSILLVSFSTLVSVRRTLRDKQNAVSQKDKKVYIKQFIVAIIFIYAKTTSFQISCLLDVHWSVASVIKENNKTVYCNFKVPKTKIKLKLMMLTKTTFVASKSLFLKIYVHK